MAKILICGAGAFGSALAVACLRAGQQVTVWSRSLPTWLQDRRHPKLPGLQLPQEIRFTTTLEDAADCQLLLLAVPSYAIRETCRRVRPQLGKQAIVVCAAKGLEEESFQDFVSVIEEELPQNPCAALSGPSFAAEIARGVPTTVVVASRDQAAAQQVQELLMNTSLRIYLSDDVVGVELGGALKNIIAVCSGICDGLLDGAANPKAALMTRGITEIARLGVALGGRRETFAGLAGIGDLMLTCSSEQSRNYRFGKLLSQGLGAQEAMERIGMVVEGYYCTRSAYRLAQQKGVDMPIVTQAYQVLYEGKDPAQALLDLMGRPRRWESETVWFQLPEEL